MKNSFCRSKPVARKLGAAAAKVGALGERACSTDTQQPTKLETSSRCLRMRSSAMTALVPPEPKSGDGGEQVDQQNRYVLYSAINQGELTANIKIL